MTQVMMKNLWKTLAILSAFVGAVHCLTCLSCPVGLSGICLVSNEVTCNNAAESCFTGEAQLNSTEIITLHTRGCLDNNLCGTLTGTLLGVGYTVSLQCCNTTLCNGASSVHISLTVALCAALLSSLWGNL